MKSYKILSTLILLIFSTPFIFAQLMGNSENGGSPSQEVGASSITSGGLSGDVNLFSGTFNTTQVLGSVSTPSGLSFTASLSYNSSFAAGDNLPQSSGIPYGEGWSLDVPTITISTEDYNRYTLSDLPRMGQVNDLYSCYNNITNPSQSYITDGNDCNNVNGTPATPSFYDGDCDRALEEGRLYWFAPMLNLPGVASGRLVYKEREGDEEVFVLHKFERYIEARLLKSSDNAWEHWKIIVDDGTQYELKAQTVSHRHASNQRVQTQCNPDIDDNSNTNNRDVLANLVLPKTEILTWYCNRITHPNKAGAISFIYKKLGEFDYFKVLSQYEHENHSSNEISRYFYPSSPKKRRDVTYKDIILEEINSGYERLILNHNNILKTEFQPELIEEGHKLITPTDANQKDDGLYAFETVQFWGGISFDNWRQYLHSKGTLSNETVGADPNNATQGGTSPTNPYIFTQKVGSTLFDKVLSRESAESITGGLNFTHSPKDWVYPNSGPEYKKTVKTGYLESPRINGSDFIPGDTYEIKANITGSQSLYDINLATGDNSFFPSSGNFPNAECYGKATNQSVFTTFNQGFKWLSGNVSNFFVMPNHPNEFNGFHVQVGPANSDINYNFLENFGAATGGTSNPEVSPWNIESYHNRNGALNSGSGTYGGGVCQEVGTSFALRSGHSIPNNFGIGSPWYTLQGFYAVEGFINHDIDRFWWNQNPALYQWNNFPTAPSESAKVDNIEIIRYTKNPYMLTSAVSQTKSQLGWVSTSNMAFKYGVEKARRFVNYHTNNPCDDVAVETSVTDSYRNVFVLEAIRQLPIGSTDFDSDPSAPTTRLTYTKESLQNPSAPYNGSIHNTNFVYLTGITNPLGKETTIQYYPLGQTLNEMNAIPNGSYAVQSLLFTARPKTDVITHPSSFSCSNGTPKTPANPYAYQIYMVVQSKSVVAKNGNILGWNYSFSNPEGYSSSPSMDAHFAADPVPSFKVGFRNCTVVGPTSSGVGPSTSYTHYVDKLMWGKVRQVSSADVNGALTSTTDITYSSTLAFDKLWNNSTSHPDFTPTNRMYDVPYFYETRYVDAIEGKDPNYLKSFFIKKDSEITKNYDVNGQYISTQTDYQYYDSQSATGYSVLGANQWGSNPDKKFSFLPYKTKTYSAEHGGSGGAYSETEYFYLFDLVKLSQYNSSSSFFSTLLNNGMRNVPFQVRKTVKGINDDPIVQSSYQIYTLNGGKIRLKQTAVQAENGLGGLVSFDASMNPTFPLETLITNTTFSWNQDNQPTLVENAKGLRTLFTYTSNGLLYYQNVGEGQTPSYATAYRYNGDNRLRYILPVSGVKTNYEYDEYGRVSKILKNNKAIQSFDYSNYMDGAGGSFLSRAKDNSVTTINHIDNSGGWSEIAYVDPLGRNIANEKAGTIFGYNVFDAWGRATVVLKPVASGSFTSLEGGIAGGAASHAEYNYESAPRGTVTESSKYGESINGNHIVTSISAIVTGGDLAGQLAPTNPAFGISGGKFYRSEVTDEDGKVSISFTNAMGQLAATISNNGAYSTVFEYDSHGKVSKTGNPEQQVSEYKHNYFGQIYEKITVDAADVVYGYNSTGELIAQDDGTGRIYHYDIFGRMTSQCRSTSVSAFTNNDGMAWVGDAQFDATYESAINSALGSDREKEWFYDNYDASRWNEYFANTQYYLDNSLSGKSGRLVQTVSYDLENEVSEFRFFSYNSDGFIKWEMVHYKGVSADDPKGLLVRIDYPRYNHQGSVLEQNVDINSDHKLDFQYKYVYDGQSRVTGVYANYDDPDGNSYGHQLASYTYDDLKGVVATMDYYGGGADDCTAVDHFDYTYDIRRRLTDIQSNLFAQSLVYDGNGPLDGHSAGFSNNFNGNINTTQASYTLSLASNAPTGVFDGGTIYNYEYDDVNRLTDATARVEMNNGVFVPNLGNVVYDFDKVGNIQNLQRKALHPDNPSQVISQNYIYNYSASSNRLEFVKETGQSSSIRNFSYDAKGNLTYDSKRGLTVSDYGRANLPWIINMAHHPDDPNSPGYEVSYLYDINDGRMFKQADGKQELYIRTTSGQEVAIYDVTEDQLTWYVHGVERIASIINQVPLEFSDEKADEGVDPCPPIDNTPIPIPIPPTEECCNSKTSSEKEEEVNNLRVTISGKSVSNVLYPSKLYRVKGCEGIEMNAFEEELEESPIDYEILATVIVEKPQQRYNLELSTGETLYQVDLEEMLQTRVDDEPVKINGYVDTPTNYTPSDPYNCDMEETPNAPVPNAGYYVYDHLGNTRIHYGIDCTSGGLDYILHHVVDYFPYGKVLREFRPNAAEKFLTTQHERDVETGLDYRGARFYDSDIARFLSLDPLAADYASWSAYNYVLGNPLMFIDPDGKSADWVPKVHYNKNDKNHKTSGYLELEIEDGDDAKSLAKFLNVSAGTAKTLFNSMSSDGRIKLTNNVPGVEAINKDINAMIDRMLVKNGYQGTGLHDFNCFADCLAISAGNTPTNGDVGDVDFVNRLNSSEFSKVSSPQFGTSIVQFGEDIQVSNFSLFSPSTWFNSKTVTQQKTNHGAIYLGTSKATGSQYFWSKNGHFDTVSPDVSTSETLQNSFSYGRILGYYNRN